jgi:DNA-directed RNA polymerase subunit H (RpoH/RPB5)
MYTIPITAVVIVVNTSPNDMKKGILKMNGIEDNLLPKIKYPDGK